jgi:hypothetical protein
MSIFRLDPDFFSVFSLEANPSRRFVSSSAGLTGAISVFAQKSPIEKEFHRQGFFKDDRAFDDDNLEATRDKILYARQYTTSIEEAMEEYLSGVNAQSTTERKQKQVEILRFMPSVRFTSDTLRKNVVRKILFPYYRTRYPTAQWAYTNYHTLNFFTSSQVPTGSCMIYPAASASIADGSKAYYPSSSFTFDFYINPRYTTDDDAQEYHAGTIFHMSSSYAVSLVSGSGVGSPRPDRFRVMLQLSASAEIQPSVVSLTGSNPAIYNARPIDDVYPDTTTYNRSTERGTATNLIFLSSDNSLKLNTWHHVAVRWDATVDDGRGSIVIDGVQDTTFLIPSKSCMPAVFESPLGDPDALFVGNFYDGANDTDKGALISQFFNPNASSKYGVINLFGSDTSINDPPVGDRVFAHPLNAEVHELKIYNSYRSLPQTITSSLKGTEEVGTDLLFYVPPFFVKESRTREVLQTPFQSTSTKTDDPFNVALSFGLGGHLLNLENFVREFVRKRYPRLYNLEMSTLSAQTNTAESCNTILYATASNRKRNLTVLPCDNGRFKPGFRLLASGSTSTVPGAGSLLDKYTNDFGALDFSYISLTDLVPTASIQPGLFQYAISKLEKKEALDISADPLGRGVIAPRLIELNDDGTPKKASPSVSPSGLVDTSTATTGKYILKDTDYPDAVDGTSIAAGIMGASPENPGVASGSILTILQRTRDNTSDEVVFFDVCNLFYGQQIKHNSFSLKDTSVTGSGGKVSITLRDDGKGNLYRGDATTPHPTWSSVGNLLYEEGIAVVKSPNIPLFGNTAFEVNLKGVHNIHILEVNVPCPAGSINSSSNPSFKPLKPSDYADTVEKEFVYVTGLNFHDENLNIIARTNLAQPVVKKDKDKFKFRVKLDF